MWIFDGPGRGATKPTLFKGQRTTQHGPESKDKLFKPLSH